MGYGDREKHTWEPIHITTIKNYSQCVNAKSTSVFFVGALYYFKIIAMKNSINNRHMI